MEGVEEAPGLYGEEGCGGGGRGARAVAGEEEAAEVAGKAPVGLQILPLVKDCQLPGD